MPKCAICNEEAEELYGCDLCKKQVCEECINRKLLDEDDYMDVCIACDEDKFDGGR